VVLLLPCPQVARVLPHVDLVNAYGPTEATVYITHHTFDKSEKHMRPTISIGKPLTNSKCYVVDRKIVSDTWWLHRFVDLLQCH
jgi:non-ribosomal peptide synthetase component F